MFRFQFGGDMAFGCNTASRDAKNRRHYNITTCTPPKTDQSTKSIASQPT